ncbi:MAG: PEGA domain-containing protein [Chthoniobacter sp.]
MAKVEPAKPEAVPDPKPPKTTPIIVNTMPSGANVFLNGEDKGKSPLQLENVGVGSWRLKVEREGYESAEFIVEVREDGTTQPPLVELVRKPAASSPAPAPKLAAAATPTPPPVSSPPPVASSSAAAPNAGAIMSVVSGYTHALETGNANDYIALCAPRVGYFDEGQKTRDYIRRSRDMFMTHWSNYEVRNIRGVDIREAPDGASAHVSFAYDWSANSLGSHASKHHSISPGPKRGSVTDTLDMQKIDGRWLITKMWQVKMDR